MRRYDDTIDVRLAQGAGEHGGDRAGSSAGSSAGSAESSAGQSAGQPDAFVWRDRLYVVRAVQTRWYERRAWWREAAAAALLGLRGDEQHRGDVATAAPGTTGYLDGETEVWRVEAAAGRSGPVGVFDLARSVPTSGAAPGGWRLTRVAD